MKYLCFYDIKKYEQENRNYVLSATNKIDYIISTLNRNNIKVDIISASRCNKKGTKGKKRIENIGNGNTLRLFSSRGGNIIIRILDKLKHSIIFFLWNAFNMKKGETIICYHSLEYYRIIKLLKKLKKIKLILEVEEIYSDVIGNNRLRKREISFLSLADGYIFSTELLNEEINFYKKPYIIVYGNYKNEKKFESLFNDNKIHVVYAGTFNQKKGGATIAVNTGRFLTSNYIVHILGFGNEKDTRNIKKLCNEVTKISEAKVIFEGLKSGDDFLKFLQSCDIGLSTQDPNAAYNNTSFPSKILSYMSNGLRVVSIRIPAVEKSSISRNIYFYENQNPEDIAKTIISINLQSNYNSIKTIKKLDEMTVNNLKNFLHVI